MRVPLVYKKQPVLGFDIGTHSIKIVQAQPGKHTVKVVGFGAAEFPANSIVEGLVVDAIGLAKIVRPLLDRPTAGKLTARRVVASVPVSKVFTRILQLPKMEKGDLQQAITLQVEQYVPVPLSDLYVDYEIIQSSSLTPADHIDVLMVAAPKSIIDSYIKLFDALNLEVEAIEVSLAALTRAMVSASSSRQAILVVDFGSRSADLAIFDQVIRLTGTLAVGGDQMTEAIAKKLDIETNRAEEAKIKFGITESKLQGKVALALEPLLQSLVSEIRKTLKYYAERSEAKNPVQTIMLSGGSAAMPGLTDYLYEQLKVPVIVGNPWKNLDLGKFESNQAGAPMYSTAIGLAMEGLND